MNKYSYYNNSYSDNISYYNDNKNNYNDFYKSEYFNNDNKINDFHRANTYNISYNNTNYTILNNTYDNLYNPSYNNINNNKINKLNNLNIQYNNSNNGVYNGIITNKVNSLNAQYNNSNNIIYNYNITNSLEGGYINSNNNINNNILTNQENSLNNQLNNSYDSKYNNSTDYNNNSSIIFPSNIYNNYTLNNITDETNNLNKKIQNNDFWQYNRSKTHNIIQPSSLKLENMKKEKEIDKTVINLVLTNTIEQYFVLKDFLKLKNKEKDILNYFYLKEKLCLEWLNTNFVQENNTKKILKNLILKTIQQIYEGIEEFSKKRKSIKSKINKILEEIETKKIYDNLEEMYKKELGVENLPKFLANDIDKSIENIKYLEKFNKNYDHMNNIYELNQMLVFYYGFVRGEKQPFNISNINGDLFMILLYSNLKDIYKSKNIQKIFLNNYNSIIHCFNIFDFDYNTFYNLVSKSDLKFNENEKLKKHFSNYKKEQNFQMHLYVLSSYYYLIMNIMRDTSDKYNVGAFMNLRNNIFEINLNNPLLGKILRNVINNFVKFSPCDKLNSSIYPYLINFLSIYIILEDNKKSKEQNKIYEISDILQTVNKSTLPDVKSSTIMSFLTKLNQVESSNISIPKFLTKIKEFFLDDEEEENETKKISLTPLSLRRSSNIITILISGFGSERESIYSWRNFIDFEPKFSNFYYLKWPSGNLAEMISIIPFSEKFVLEMPKKFINNKLKGKLVGKILGLFLASNEDFKKCQINLVGFSLGCHVIKYCIKEISKLRGVRNMINNVLLMGGAASIGDKKNWKNIVKKVIGGRIINCYSKHDFVLDTLFKLCVDHTAIGTRQLTIRDENTGINMVENYDLSDLELGHLEYRKNFGKILKRINFY